MSLYLKYRPKRVEELDLENVRSVFFEIIKSNKTSHAYLFTGPRGAGKTSAARIMARIVNCEKNRTKLAEPCNECQACRSILNGSAVDVIELDAASNRGIDDVRELKEKIKLAPAVLPKKVYIIDEVHMMTTDAFNALLKTLEEPPAHSLFILCTTESHKLPETIVSRCTQVIFTKAKREEMKRSFARVMQGEKVEIDDEALDLLSLAVDGSFRDGIKLLDQALSKGVKVTRQVMEEMIYGASGYQGRELATAMAELSLDKSLAIFREAINRGVDLGYLLTDLMKNLRELVVAGKIELVELIYALDEVARKLSASPVPAILAEVAIIKWCTRSDGKNVSRQSGSSHSLGPAGDDKADVKSGSALSKTIANNVDMKGNDIWGRMMQDITGADYSMGALLSKARPGVISGNELTIEVKYEFHREQIMNGKFRARIEEMISEIVGYRMMIKCEVNPEIDKLKSNGELDILAEAEAIFIN